MCSPSGGVSFEAIEPAGGKLFSKLKTEVESNLHRVRRHELVWTSTPEPVAKDRFSVWDFAGLGMVTSDPEPPERTRDVLKFCATSLQPLSDYAILREARWPMKLVWITREQSALRARRLAFQKAEFAAYATSLGDALVRA